MRQGGYYNFIFVGILIGQDKFYFDCFMTINFTVCFTLGLDMD